MSLLEPLSCDDDFLFSDSKNTSDTQANLEEFVHPQTPVKPNSITQLEFVTPDNSPTDPTLRRESFAGSYFCDSSTASSFTSQSGCGTPSMSTPGSSASTSRRQSMLLPSCQPYYSSAISSPSNRPQGPKRAAATDQCPLREYSPGPYLAFPDAASSITDDAVACVPGSEFDTAIGDPTGNALMQRQSHVPQTATSPLCSRTAQVVQIDESTSWNWNSPIHTRASNTFEFRQPLFSPEQPSIFGNPPSQLDGNAYSTEDNSSSNAPSLAPPFEHCEVKYEPDLEYADEDVMPTPGCSYPSGIPIRLALNNKSPTLSDDSVDYEDRTYSKAKNRKQRQRLPAVRKIPSQRHKCPAFDCPYACNRPEHLRRHEHSKHMKEKTEMLPCKFHGCIDPKTRGPREIIARPDNLKAHYTKTHFRYGISEKGGKNERKSMKAAYEMGLHVYDCRWEQLLQQEMNVNREIKDYLHVWKMLGYSILETREMKVKDVRPDWHDGPDDTTLQKFDPRWKALWDETLTFDQAMSVGTNMKESDAQGLLGVTMLETEAMGIRDFDPRWKAMLDGRMSIEQSEKLGVKHRNPQVKDFARRRTR